MAEIIKTEQITSVKLHIHCSHLFTFQNTFLMETLKMYAKGIRFEVVRHNHPLGEVSDLPFIIVNDAHLVSGKKIGGLIEVIAVENPTRAILFKSIMEICEEISAVGRILSEESKNPYFLFLSPLKKFEVFRWNHNFKKHIFETTQYFDANSEELNNDYFLYKLNTLADLGSKVDSNVLLTLCIFSMIKSLKIDNKNLYDATIKNVVFQNFEQKGFEIIGMEVQPEIGIPRYIGSVKEELYEDGEKQIKEAGPNPPVWASPMEGISKFALPLIIYGVFWKIQSYYSIKAN